MNIIYSTLRSQKPASPCVVLLVILYTMGRTLAFSTQVDAGARSLPHVSVNIVPYAQTSHVTVVIGDSHGTGVHHSPCRRCHARQGTVWIGDPVTVNTVVVVQLRELGTDGASAGVPEVVAANNSIALILENA
ncbi:hypothetical protein EDB89DRAFT_1945546 [Lactarius sanguifluus]|nr:hypothetical protein EDB89DRAFT_1945546 [Lactarius sanguifluus]